MSKKLMAGLIPYEGYITRDELVKETGLSDRWVRRYIEELRKEGYRITTSDHKKGYKYASNDKEVDELLIVFKSRIRTELETLSALMGEEEAISWIMDDVINKTTYTG